MIDRRSLAGALLLLMAPAAVLEAQPRAGGDSLTMERRIERAAADVTFPQGARALLLERLMAGDPADARRVIDFMERRRQYSPSPWITPRERLLAEILVAPLELIRNREQLERMLIRDRDTPDGSAPFIDPLGERLRDLLRQTVDQQLRSIAASGAGSSEMRFAGILLNWLHIRGYRPRMDLNARIEEFAVDEPNDPLARLATSYLVSYYSQSRLGGAFVAGYTGGIPAGRLAERVTRYGAPSLAGELFYGPATVTAQVHIGVADAPEAFSAGGARWESGSTSLVVGELTAGFEVRIGRLAVTPSAGLALFSAAGAHAAEEADPPRTDALSGWVANMGFGYRIPSDVGPHFDLRAKIGYLSSGLDSYDPSFGGSIVYLQIGFALVQRPWADRAE